MQLKYMGSNSWLAPHVDRLWDVAVPTLPSSALKSWNTTLPSASGPKGAWRRRL